MLLDENHIQDRYKSISAPATGLFKDKGSRFIAHSFPVENETEIKEIIESLKKEYHDARHHCYAYRLGRLGNKFRANDDGEPSSSAGRPILGQIISNELSDILIVVVRYFGGIKLGIPGLIRAYKTASAEAISNSEIIVKTECRDFRLLFEYMSIESVMRLIKDLRIAILSQTITESCILDVRVKLSQELLFIEKISNINGCRYERL
jgi:hypothetical protein